eukprot:GEMP01007019.1.p1 GENE.GEMP01007019.1~~GEMP01007019.1.p1  ORF type:complete len:786 (+),score=167.80 GEMP01007019.1:524-2881(+)
MIALYAAFTAVVLAGGGILFQMRADNNENVPEEDRRYFAPEHVDYYTNWKFRYANFVSLGIGAFEFVLRLAVRSSGPPFVTFSRAFLLAIFATICAFSFFTLIPCILYAVAALLAAVSAVRWEQGKVEHFGIVAICRGMKRMIGRCCCVRARKRTKELRRVKKNAQGIVLTPSWWHYQVARGFVARLCLVILWFVITVALGFKHYYQTMWALKVYTKDPNDATCWIKKGDDQKCIRYGDAILLYVPIAKAFGFCLDFNCALILLLVVQSIVTKFNEWVGRKSGMLLWVPVHKLLLFHKFVGAAVFLLSLGHTFAHFMAQSYVLDLNNYVITLTMYFNYSNADWVMTSAWVSGVVLFVFMVISYGSAMGPARRINYSLFFKVHVGFALAFIVVLFYHAEQFLFTGIIPFILYLQDRARRSVSEECSLRLTEAELIDSVLALTFITPFKYKSGTYCRLRCPSLSATRAKEWHPFTISSAYSSNTVGFHIKVHPGGWTEAVRDLMIEVARSSEAKMLGKKLFDNERGFRYQFKARDWLTGDEILGLSPSWNGIPLIVCSAPHAAPAMHHDRFETIIIAGAGIGLTPVNSVITEILHYKWRKGVDIKVKNMYAAWMCPQDNLGAFRWFMESASNCDLAYKLCDSKKFHYEMHFYVTSAAAPDATSPRVVPTVTQQKTYDDGINTAIRPYCAISLLDATKAAETPVSQFAEVMTNTTWRNAAFGRTKIWNGRPDWEELFQRISDRHADPKKGHGVGVFFCGAPIIVDSIRQSAQLFTNKAISFHVFKENF